MGAPFILQYSLFSLTCMLLIKMQENKKPMVASGKGYAHCAILCSMIANSKCSNRNYESEVETGSRDILDLK